MLAYVCGCDKELHSRKVFRHSELLVLRVLGARNVLFHPRGVREVTRAHKTIVQSKLANVGFQKSYYLNFACFLAKLWIEMLEKNMVRVFFGTSNLVFRDFQRKLVL